MRKTMPRIVLATVLLGSASLAAAQDDYVPWDEVRFGMGVTQLRELYPDIRHAEGLDEHTANSTMPWENYFLSKRKFGPLEGCAVHFMLMRGELARMNFYCSKYGPEEVAKVLEEKYGFPTFTDQLQIAWMEGPARINMNRNSGWIGIGHVAKNDAIVKSTLAPAYEVLKARMRAEKAGAAEGASGGQVEAEGGASGEAATEGGQPEE